jgi:hypothetical protein
MLRAGPDGPTFMIGEPGPFQFSRPGSLSEALATAGFVEVEEQTHTNDWVWQGDARSFWNFMQETSGAALAADEHTALARLKAFERNDTLVFPVEVHCARAHQPSQGGPM